MGNTLEKLSDCGIDVNVGLGYFDGDEAQYLSILEEFSYSAPVRQRAIRQFWQDRDWNNYVIAVHSLKSTARNIGAVALSQKALQLELCGKERQYGKVDELTDELLSDFETVFHRLEPLCRRQQTDKKGMDRGQVCNLLGALIAAAEDYDFMTSEELIEELNGFAYGERQQKMMDKVAETMRELDYGGCAQAARELMDESDRL